MQHPKVIEQNDLSNEFELKIVIRDIVGSV